MERLSPEQSSLLKRIYSSPVYYDDLSDPDRNICQFLLNQKYVTATKRSKSSSSNGFFKCWNEYDIVSISEAGRMYLINESLSVDLSLFLEKQLQSLRDLAGSAKTQADQAVEESKHLKLIAKSANKQAEEAVKEAIHLKEIADQSKRQADIAKAESDSARKDASFSKVISIIAIIISILAIVVPIINA